MYKSNKKQGSKANTSGASGKGEKKRGKKKPDQLNTSSEESPMTDEILASPAGKKSDKAAKSLEKKESTEQIATSKESSMVSDLSDSTAPTAGKESDNAVIIHNKKKPRQRKTSSEKSVVSVSAGKESDKMPQNSETSNKCKKNRDRKSGAKDGKLQPNAEPSTSSSAKKEVSNKRRKEKGQNTDILDSFEENSGAGKKRRLDIDNSNRVKGSLQSKSLCTSTQNSKFNASSDESLISGVSGIGSSEVEDTVALIRQWGAPQSVLDIVRGNIAKHIVVQVKINRFLFQL